MASLKDVKNKIVGVKKTKQITKAMYMVSSAKLRGAQQRIEQFRAYADKYYEVLSSLAPSMDSSAHPLLEVREETIRIGIVLISSDRGLCGSFNINLINTALKLADKLSQEGKEVLFYCVGKKAVDAIRKSKYRMELSLAGLMTSFDYHLAQRISNQVIDAFLQGELDGVQIIHGEFHNVAKQSPKVLPILPITATETDNSQQFNNDEFTYEPSITSLLAELLPRFISVQMYRALLDTSASEHAARMTAMNNATRSCDDITTALTLLFNKTRQAAITRDLMDIVGGAEALNS